jgi:hypothetical protein
MGMNSVLAVSLAAALEAEFSVSLPASVAFDYGTLKDLVRPLFDPSLTHQLESPRSQSSL